MTEKIPQFLDSIIQLAGEAKDFAAKQDWKQVLELVESIQSDARSIIHKQLPSEAFEL